MADRLLTSHSLALLVRYIHHLLLLFNIFAPAIPSKTAWIVHVLLLPALIVHWRLNRNTCVLTNLENVLLGRPAYGTEGESQFIAQIVEKFVQPAPSKRTIEVGTYVVMTVVWSLSVLRLLNT